MNRSIVSITVLLTVLPTLLSGCGLSGTTPREILEGPAEFHGRDVTVEGQIQNVRTIDEAGVFGYTVTTGADSVLVLDPAEPSVPEGKARVSGRVHSWFVVEGRPRVVLLRGLDS